MSRKFELKWVDEEVWEQTPDNIQEKKMRFGTLQHYIKIRKNRIERLKKKIKELQLERIEWEKERTSLYHELISFQNEFIPSVSSTSQSGNYYQWSINLKIGGIKRNKYLGSNKNVRIQLDEIFGSNLYYEKMGSISNDLSKKCKQEIDKIIQRNLAKELEKDFDGIIKKWENDELIMWDYFN